MTKERITRRQKDISRLLRERKQAHSEKLKAFKTRIPKNIISPAVALFIFFSIFIIHPCLALPPDSGSMQTSPELQQFKEQQQKKMQAYLAQFEKENKEFLGVLMQTAGRNDKLNSLKSFITKQYNKNSAFRKQMYEEQRAFIKGRLDANPQVQSFMKDRMLSRIDEDYAGLKEFHAQKFTEDMEFIKGLLKDASIAGQELNKALQEFFQSQKADAAEFLQTQQQRYKNP